MRIFCISPELDTDPLHLYASSIMGTQTWSQRLQRWRLGLGVGLWFVWTGLCQREPPDALEADLPALGEVVHSNTHEGL